MTLRRPAVAGTFYPSDPGELRAAISDCYTHPLGPGALPPSEETRQGVLACVSPHAGYMYSGPVAAHTYRSISSQRSPEVAVIVGPNHYGVGSGVATWREGEWETPLGRVRVDSAGAEKIADLTGIVDFDTLAHSKEHSLEVQVPFLQAIYGDSFALLPISLALQDIETARDLGRGISRLLQGREAILIASSDLTHYEPAPIARDKDTALLECVSRLDTAAFYGVLERRNVTACGYGAIATVMEAARSLGFVRGRVQKYATSGDVTGENDSVVGYPSVFFTR